MKTPIQLVGFNHKLKLDNTFESEADIEDSRGNRLTLWARGEADMPDPEFFRRLVASVNALANVPVKTIESAKFGLRAD